MIGPDDDSVLLEAVRQIVEEIDAPPLHRGPPPLFWSPASPVPTHAATLNRLFVPVAHGGAGASPRVQAAVMRMIAEACTTTALVCAATRATARALADFAGDGRKERLLPTIASGAIVAVGGVLPSSDAAPGSSGITLVAERDGFVVRGRTSFAPWVETADFLLVGCRRQEGSTSDRSDALLLLDARRCRTAAEHVSYANDCPIATVTFADQLAPKSALLGDPLAGAATHAVIRDDFASGLTTISLGVARRAFRRMDAYLGAERRAGRPVIGYPGEQFAFAGFATELEALEHRSGRLSSGSNEADGLNSVVDPLDACGLALRIARGAFELFGGRYRCADPVVGRLLRDATALHALVGTPTRYQNTFQGAL